MFLNLGLIIFFCNWNRAGAFFGNKYYFYVINTTAGSAQIVEKCEATIAESWGKFIDDDGVDGCAVAVQPIDACGSSTVLKPDVNDTQRYPTCFEYGSFALTERGNCTFGEKAYCAQSNQYGGLIVMNYPNETGPIASLMPDRHATEIDIPVLSVSYRCGIRAATNYTYQKGFIFVLRSSFNADLTKYLLPFVIILGICILIMCAGMIIKCVRERRQVMRRRLSRRDLRKIPTRKYVKGDDQDTCPICLDDFDDGDKLRVLPCNHVYHCKCVDPWLTKTRKICPVCKRKVFSGDDSSSSDDDEQRTQNNTTQATDSATETDERQPLLGHSSPPGLGRQVGGSTFYTSYSTINSVDDTLAQDAVNDNSFIPGSSSTVPCVVTDSRKRKKKTPSSLSVNNITTPHSTSSGDDVDNNLDHDNRCGSNKNLLLMSSSTVEDQRNTAGTPTSVSAVLHALPFRRGSGYTKLRSTSDDESEDKPAQPPSHCLISEDERDIIEDNNGRLDVSLVPVTDHPAEGNDVNPIV